jgi:hypothetical protein
MLNAPRIMDINESRYMACRNGVFFLPDAVLTSLAAFVLKGVVYLREDADMLTISSTKVTGGHRRVMGSRFRASMFRDATMLAIVDFKDSIRIMGVEWKC